MWLPIDFDPSVNNFGRNLKLWFHLIFYEVKFKRDLISLFYVIYM